VELHLLAAVAAVAILERALLMVAAVVV